MCCLHYRCCTTLSRDTSPVPAILRCCKENYERRRERLANSRGAGSIGGTRFIRRKIGTGMGAGSDGTYLNVSWCFVPPAMASSAGGRGSSVGPSGSSGSSAGSLGKPATAHTDIGGVGWGGRGGVGVGWGDWLIFGGPLVTDQPILSVALFRLSFKIFDLVPTLMWLLWLQCSVYAPFVYRCHWW